MLKRFAVTFVGQRLINPRPPAPRYVVVMAKGLEDAKDTVARTYKVVNVTGVSEIRPQ